MAELRFTISNKETVDQYIPMPDAKDLMPWQITLVKLSMNERISIPTRQSSSCVRTQGVKLKRFYETVKVQPGQSYEVVLQLSKILIEPLSGKYEITVSNGNIQFQSELLFE